MPTRSSKTTWVAVAAVAAIAVGVRLLVLDDTPLRPRPGPNSSATTPVTDHTVRALCSQCHTFPKPAILPRSEWRTRIGQMATFKGYGTKVQGIVNTQSVIRWYESRAPQSLHRPVLDDQLDAGQLDFLVREMACDHSTVDPLVISNVLIVDLLDDTHPTATGTRNSPSSTSAAELIACDMANGLILLGRARPAWSSKMTVLAQVGHPARVQGVDLDHDGLQDLLVADLGSFGAIDHNLGKVTWLRQHPPGTFTPIDLATGLPRVADVRAADFDNDGDLDLVVGAFGWRTTGQVLLMEHSGRPGPPSPASYTTRQLDQRHGTIHTIPTDLNNDGHLDFVSLFAQEHESVVAFIGTGRLGFTARTLFQAPHPCWGSSGIQLLDLDGDGDTDVLMTNGDTMDDAMLKPDHGIRWLENHGDDTPFTPHHLARLYGVHRAEAADIDNDGDVDIVACGFVGELKGISRSELLNTLKVPSLLWIEQTSPQVFRTRTLEAHLCNHPTLALGDIDGDGDIDIAVGNNTHSDSETPVEVWINAIGDSR